MTTKQILTGLLIEPFALASTRGATFGAAFDSWFAKACAREPSDRFTTAREQTEALAAALGEAVLEERISLPADRRSSSPTPVPSRTLGSAPTLDASVTSASELALPRRSRMPLMMALALLATLGALAYLLVRDHAAPNPAVASSTLVIATTSSPPPAPLEPVVLEAPSATPSATSPPPPATTRVVLLPPRPSGSASARPKPSASVDPLGSQE